MSTPAIVLPPGVPIPNIDHTLGVILVCLIIAAYFFGMSSSQAYIYYDRFPKDPWTYKTLVAVTWALDTLHTALMSHTVYYYTVTHFGDYLALTTKPTWSFNLEILIVPIIALIVQWFFAYRAYSIDRDNWPLALTIATLAVIQLGFGITSSVFSFTQIKGFYDIRRFDWSLITWLATGAAANILVCVSLVWTFYTSKTTFNEDDGWMTKILMYGVHTGAFTTLTTIIDVIFIASWKGTLVATGLNYILGKFYTNTMFYALNRRMVTDPRYQTKSGSASSRNAKSGGQNASSIMPTFAPNLHSLSAPRVQVRDPYAPDVEYENDKPPSLTEPDPERNAQLELKVDHRSDASFVSGDKDMLDAHRDRDSDL